MFDFKDYGADERQKKKKLAIIIIAVTIVLIIAVSSVLIVNLVKNSGADDPTPPDNAPTNDGNGGTTVTSSKNLAFSATKSGTLLLVNKDSEAYDFTANPETNLADISENIPKTQQSATPIYSCASGLKANRTALTEFNNMMKAYYNAAADKEVARKINIDIAYRNFDQQAGGAFPQGHSDFHTGMLFDLVADNAPLSATTYAWIFENAHKYGFVARYPDAKADITGVDNLDSAFRYVGIAHATYMYQNSLCLEEYIDLVKTKTQSSPLSIGSTYDVYYVKANTEGETTVPLSNRYPCEISGDNNGGFIVTVTKSSS